MGQVWRRALESIKGTAWEGNKELVLVLPEKHMEGQRGGKEDTQAGDELLKSKEQYWHKNKQLQTGQKQI